MDEPLEAGESNPSTRDSQLAAPLHSIRLRHPWKCETTDEAILWSRKFNWPADPDESERVRLVTEGLPTSAKLSLNDQPLAVSSSPSRDITDQLNVHNQLVIAIELSSGDPPERFPYEVRLEIVAAC